MSSFITEFEWNVSGATTFACNVKSSIANGETYPSAGGGSTIIGGGGGSDAIATTSTLGSIIVGENLKITPAGVLSVDMAENISGDNTKPVSAAKVYTEIGNINVLLGTI